MRVEDHTSRAIPCHHRREFGNVLPEYTPISDVDAQIWIFILDAVCTEPF